MSFLRKLNAAPWWLRCPIKSLIMATVTLLVFFPRVDRLISQLRLPDDPNQLIDPDSAALQPWLAEFEQLRRPHWEDSTVLRRMEEFILKRIKPAYDWEVWGNIDYFPTVEEVIESGREDCDGRALVAASMLRKLGHDAWLVKDPTHMWVATNLGEILGLGHKDGTKAGAKASALSFGQLQTLPRRYSFVVSVFPLARELILLFFFLLLLFDPNVRVKDALIWIVSLILALMLVREGGNGDPLHTDLVKVWLGAGIWLLASYGLADVLTKRSEHSSTPNPSAVTALAD